MTLEQIRTITRYSFYLLFLAAPILDIFRFDLTEGHFMVFGKAWTLGLQSSEYLCYDPGLQVQNMLLNFGLPAIVLILTLIAIAWKYGRIYCGWLCPHFSVVESINKLMLKYLGRATVWEASPRKTGLFSWLLVLAVCALIAFVWSFTFLSYLLPPKALALGLYRAELSYGPSLFLLVTTIVLMMDFFFARHLFCRYGCSYGLLQSFSWMANSRAMVVGFDKSRANICQTCDNECDKACPMRLPVRGIKRAKFTCTQCNVCLTVCDEVQAGANNQEPRVINWVKNEEAMGVDRQAASSTKRRLRS